MVKGLNKNLGNALKIVKKNKESSAVKKKKKHVERLIPMQRYLDLTKEKRTKFLNIIKNTIDEKTGLTILEKGCIVYVELHDVLAVLEKDLEENGIENKSITGKILINKRKKITEWFNDNPCNKIVFITAAGGQSIDLHSTNEIVLYNVPKGYRGLMQVIGRIDRAFGKYEEDGYNVHNVIVKDSIDEYNHVHQSSRKELESVLLGDDSVMIYNVTEHNKALLEKEKQRLLWQKKMKK